MITKRLTSKLACDFARYNSGADSHRVSYCGYCCRPTTRRFASHDRNADDRQATNYTRRRSTEWSNSQSRDVISPVMQRGRSSHVTLNSSNALWAPSRLNLDSTAHACMVKYLATSCYKIRCIAQNTRLTQNWVTAPTETHHRNLIKIVVVGVRTDKRTDRRMWFRNLFPCYAIAIRQIKTAKRNRLRLTQNCCCTTMRNFSVQLTVRLHNVVN